MTTSEINATRLDIFSGGGTTALVATIRERLQRRSRIIAIGRSVAGQPFVVTAPPADFAAAVDEVMSRPPAAWTAAQHAEIDGEHVGEEVARQPFFY